MKGERRGLARRAGTAIEAQTIAIVCEGEKTEDIYFTGIRQALRLSTTRLRVVGAGADPLRVVEEAMTFLSDYDHIWAVFDVEAPKPHARLMEATALAQRYGIRCGISNPCFELWLLLHFQNQTAHLDNAAARRLLRSCGCNYNDKGFDFSATWPHRQKAVEHATRLDIRQQVDNPDIRNRNPWTSVHELVGQLLNLGGRDTYR